MFKNRHYYQCRIANSDPGGEISLSDIDSLIMDHFTHILGHVHLNRNQRTIWS